MNDVTGEVLTDITGSFMFSQIIEGPYVLWVGRSGDGAKVKDIFITAGMGCEGEIVLDGTYEILP